MRDWGTHFDEETLSNLEAVWDMIFAKMAYLRNARAAMERGETEFAAFLTFRFCYVTSGCSGDPREDWDTMIEHHILTEHPFLFDDIHVACCYDYFEGTFAHSRLTGRETEWSVS